MSKKPNEQDPLRAAAETQLIHAPKPDPRPAEELLHELEVHQIELEMQNEQLRQSQVELEESRDRYVDFYDFAPVGYLTLNHEGMIDEINFTGAAILGVARSKLIHRSFDFFVAMEDRDRWRRHFINVLTRDDTLTCELAFQHDADPRFDAQLDCQRLRKAGKKPVVRVVLTNITKRKRMEADLQANAANLRAILDNSPYMAWLKDTEGRYIAVNKNYVDYVKAKDPRQIIGKTDFDLWSKELAEKYRADDAEVMATRQQKHVDDPSFDGIRIHWTETSKTPVIDENGNVLGTAGFARDITERKRTEELLLKSSEEIEDLYNNAPCGYHSLDKDGIIRRINDTELAWLGYTRDEVIGKIKWPDLITSASQQTFQENFPQLKKQGFIYELEIEIIRKDGTVFIGLINATAIYDSSGDYVMSRSTVFDITKRKRAEKLLFNND